MTDPADLRPLRVAVLVDDLHPPAWAARVLRELRGDPAARAPVHRATVGSPVVGSPVVGSPVVDRPGIDSPVASSPIVASSPVVGSPVVGSPVASSPAVGSPGIAGSARAPAVLVVVALRRPAASPAPPPRWLRAYDAVDTRIARRLADPLAPTDVRALLEGVTVIELAGSPLVHSAADEAARRLARFDLDAIVDLGSAGPAGALASAARFGVWTLLCGEPHPGLPPATWEVIARAPLTRTQLIAELPGGHRRVLYESSSATDPTSARRNRAHAYAKAAAFVRRSLRDLAAGEHTALARSTSIPVAPVAALDVHDVSVEGDSPPAAGRVPVAPAAPLTTASTPPAAPAAPLTTASAPPTVTSAPSTAATATAAPIPAAARPATPRMLARFAGAVVRDRLQRAAERKQWILAYGIDPAAGDEPARDLSRLVRIVPPADRFWADPFVVRHGDGWVILLEERIFARPHAHIAAVSVARDGTLGDVVPVLERDYHLSYPFVFSWNGAWWMIPESAHNRTVELWRATEFPRRWTLERVLLAGVEAADATLFEHAGRWWMLCTIAEPGASKDDELHVFHAATPLGPWQSHPRNPVKSTARGARPAGRPFRSGGAWVRPSQDGSRGYGGAIVLWRIDQLDEATYRETELGRIAPDWDPALVGLHTINAASGLTVIDLRIVRSRWPRLAPPRPERG